MAERLYNGVVTDEGIAQARQAKGNIGWYIIPTKYGISDVKGAFSAARTIDQVNPAWYEHGFNAISDVSYLEKNKLMFTVTIPGNAFTAPKTISEIYFYAQTPQATEYLYVLIQPINPITWNPGVTQKMSFVIALSNSDKGDIYNIQFSSPDDIEDHNKDLLAHPYLLARDGSRTATSILKYAEKLDFTNPRDIPDLEYVLNAMPTGFMTYWPVSTPPSGYLIRNGAAISRTTYSKLHTLFANAGYPYGQGDGVTTFNLPDDRNKVIQGYNGATTSNLGAVSSMGGSLGPLDASAVVNISGKTFVAPDDGWVTLRSHSDATNTDTTVTVDGAIAFRNEQGHGDGRAGSFWIYPTIPVGKGQTVKFNRGSEKKFYPKKSNSSSSSRAYLPIIKY
jgi:microcystin-dependent protein